MPVRDKGKEWGGERPLLDSPQALSYNLQTRPGPVAQLGARFNRTEEVAGSNPARSTGRHQGPIAQLGARLNGIEKVVGSNPTGSTRQLNSRPWQEQ